MWQQTIYFYVDVGIRNLALKMQSLRPLIIITRENLARRDAVSFIITGGKEDNNNNTSNRK